MASVKKQLLGTETVKAMRSRNVTSIICGLSANDMEGPFFDAGANAFMMKPFPCDHGTLKEEIFRIVDSSFSLSSEGKGMGLSDDDISSSSDIDEN